MNKGAIFTAFILLFLATTARAIPPAPWEADELIGKPAPDFTLRDLEGEKFTLRSLRGKVVLVNFWATWCPPCRIEMPSMNSLYEKLKDKGLMILGVSSDQSEDRIRKFLEKTEIKFPILLDPDNAIAPMYKVIALPTSYIIDRDGVLVKKIFGGQDWTSDETLEMFKSYISP